MRLEVNRLENPAFVKRSGMYHHHHHHHHHHHLPYFTAV
jgi:hypothetical protein